MKKIISLVLLVLSMLLVVGCENKLDIDEENGAVLNAGQYSLKVESNCAGLSLSLTDEEYQNVINNAGEDLFVLPRFYASAHDEFTSKEDINNSSKWYTALSDSADVSDMNPDTKRYFNTMNELFEIDENESCYLFKYDVILNVSEELGDVSINIDELSLPKDNIVSIILEGPDGFQEMISDGEVVSDGVLVSSINSSSSATISLYLYFNGNDENCTTIKIQSFQRSTGEFNIKLNVKENK